MMIDHAEILAQFSFVDFRVILEAVDTILLQDFKGSALRGCFGHALREFACVTGWDDCRMCRLVRKCVYAYIFETPAPKDDPFLRNKDLAAHPYIIRPSMDERRAYRCGEEIKFELVLIGRAVDYLAYFAQAFIIMGNIGLGRGKGKFILKQIYGRDEHGMERTFYQRGDTSLRFPLTPLTCSNLLGKYKEVPKRCTLRFVSRLELKEKGRIPVHSFGVFFRSLLRRIVTLAYLHNGIDCSDIDFRGLSHLADKVETVASNFNWEDAERFSNRQKHRMPFGGWRGEITFEGNLEPFWPFIVLGECVHIGKKTSFGFGQYELTVN